MSNTDFPTLANPGAPVAPQAPPARSGDAPAADPGEFDGQARPAPRPSADKPAHEPTYEQKRLAQDQARPGDKPANEAPAPPAEGEPAKFKVGKYEVDEAALGAMMERQALDDLRKATIPLNADAYKAELPADLKLPGNLNYKLDPTNPSLAAARNWAHAKGLTQDEFSQVLGIYASHEASQEFALAERSRAEIAKAGVNAPQRVDAVNKWLTATFGEADSAPLKATNVTDAHLRAWETVITKLTNQGGASFSQSHRVPPDTGGIPGFDKMSFEQQRYAQDQLAARRGGRYGG
jgi:hypothetical protein